MVLLGLVLRHMRSRPPAVGLNLTLKGGVANVELSGRNRALCFVILPVPGAKPLNVLAETGLSPIRTETCPNCQYIRGQRLGCSRFEQKRHTRQCGAIH